MSSKALLVGLIGIVIIGGGYMFLAKNVSDNESAQTNVGESQQESTDESTMPQSGKKMAFSEFIKQGGSYKCSVNQTVEGTDTKGIVYIDGDMMRGEYDVEAHGMQMTTTMVMRDGYSYSWSSMMPGMGYKVRILGGEPTTDPQVSTSGQYSWNAEQIGDYNCESWRADASVFELPASVTFTETGS